MSAMKLAEALLANIQKQAGHLSLNSAQFLNWQSPVNRLPPDVLSMIFQFVPDLPYTELDYVLWGDNGSPPWLPYYVNVGPCVQLTHVCRYWRHLTLNLPTLWANVVDSERSDVPISVVLQRSQAVPLNISLLGRPSPGMLSFLSYGGTERVRSVWWEGDSSRECPIYLNFPAPKLESVSLMGEVTEQDRHVRVSSIFKGHTPRIQQLFLASMSWLPSNNMPSLTHLNLSGYACPGLSSKILSLLERTPNLVDLGLSNIRDSSILPESRVISLPRLRRFSYRPGDGATGLGSILPHLALADDTALCMHVAAPEELARPVGLSHLPAVKTVVRACVVQDVYVCDFMAVGPASGFDVCIYTADSEDFDAMLKLALEELPLVQIKELWVVENPVCCEMTPSGRDSFRSVLHSMPDLENLVVMEESLDNLVDALLASPDPLRPPLSRKNMTVHIIMERSGVDPSTVSSLIGRLKEVDVAHIIIGYHKTYTGPRFDDAPSLLRGFESVESRYHNTLPLMDMPPVCTTYSHFYWPSWLESWPRQLDRSE
ncbi:hypothetical protein SCP_0602200 [Sparassis crispa]|uniref:Uncharacterized protein n=1 Tax=Sparassis crispa TaxID=139825 RepID=A0A401GPW9_9APHY|nr:hypothetical protein SCP_0602200 [Sparassis crispa]GBE84242.1 hypothetical protein SCP_0602200 [Sparassis crispa]